MALPGVQREMRFVALEKEALQMAWRTDSFGRARLLVYLVVVGHVRTVTLMQVVSVAVRSRADIELKIESETSTGLSDCHSLPDISGRSLWRPIRYLEFAENAQSRVFGASFVDLASTDRCDDGFDFGLETI